MQTSIATASPSENLSDNLPPAAEADPDYVALFENNIHSFDGEREEILEGIAAVLVAAFVAATGTRRPRALRF